MSTFEEGFAATEKAADSVLQALGDVSRLARQLQRDAKAGNIVAIRRGTARLEESLSLIRQQVGNATQAWPFAQDENWHICKTNTPVNCRMKPKRRDSDCLKGMAD